MITALPLRPGSARLDPPRRPQCPAALAEGLLVDAYCPGGPLSRPAVPLAAPAPLTEALATPAPAPTPSSAQTIPSDKREALSAMLGLAPSSPPSQVERDLSLFPSPILSFLNRYGVKVAILQDGQTLADSPALTGLPPQAYTLQCEVAGSMLSSALAALPPADSDAPRAYLQALSSVADALPGSLRQAGLEFRVGLASQPFTLEDLAQRRGIPDCHLQEWSTAFRALNRQQLIEDEGGLRARHGLLLLPFAYHQGRPIPENRLRDARQTTAEYVERSLGLNRAEERMVLLHEKFVPDPAPEVGHYRVAIHELGHALDHALEGIRGGQGFGARHRATLDGLYAADLARSEAGQDAFTSGRARDDVREYFAEAVEAYLTEPRGDGQDYYNGDNHRDGLRQKSPALFAYVDGIFRTEFGSDVIADPPRPQPLPPGVPDPDLDLVEIS